MPAGRSHRPLFDLLGSDVGRKRDGAPAEATKPTVRLQLQPRPPEPEPAPAPAPEPSGGGLASGRLAAILGDATVRVPLNALYFGGALVVIAGLILWIVSYRMGVSKATQDLREQFQHESLALHEPPAETTPPPIQLQPDPRALQTAPGKTGKSAPRSAAPNNTPSPPPTAGPAVLTAKGVLLGDPREHGLNYLVLASLPKGEALAAIDFLASGGVEAIGVPVESAAKTSKNPGPKAGGEQYQLIALPGVAKAQLNQTAATNLQGKVAKLGLAWQKEHRGSSNFSKVQWTKYE